MSSQEDRKKKEKKQKSKRKNLGTKKDKFRKKRKQKKGCYRMKIALAQINQSIGKIEENRIKIFDFAKKAKEQNREILNLIPKVESPETKKNLTEIYETVVKIINTIQFNPKKAKKIPNFFDYYLPVLIKIVTKYDEVENQKLKSEEGKEFLVKADKMIKDTNKAFSNILASLFQSDIIDVDADMKVYDLMLKADGITGDEIMKGSDDNEE